MGHVSVKGDQGSKQVHVNPNIIEYNGAAQTAIIPNGSTPGYNSLVISGSGTKTMPGTAFSAAGNFTLAGAVSATLVTEVTVAGTTTVSGTSNLILGGTAERLSNSGAIILNGGTFTTGSTTTETVGVLTLTDNSRIALGSGIHALTFAASDGASWTSGVVLTITGWTGAYNGTSGTEGQIFVGSSASGLTSQQLAGIRFYSGTAYFAAAILSTGEVVPIDNYITTGTIPGSPFCTGTSGISVPFTYTHATNFTGATFTAELSDYAGSFISPVTL